MTCCNDATLVKLRACSRPTNPWSNSRYRTQAHTNAPHLPHRGFTTERGYTPEPHQLQACPPASKPEDCIDHDQAHTTPGTKHQNSRDLRWPHAPDAQSIDIDFSYAPKKTYPPNVIQPTRGPMPWKSALAPSSFTIVCSVETVPEYSWPDAFFALSISRVFTTSKGVVTAAATAPAKEPHAAPCEGVVSNPCILLHAFLRPSYNGNWMKLKGISRATVVQKPR
mmetsp:Transcript_52068/g.111371  ORF Transcript_52068/g.111371 Transcript_52068/m.111371 type:complete len:224 (+) Transcript_52068:162-833(+)